MPRRGDNDGMGLFAARPEEPFDWAGLPAEPETPHTDAELLERPPVDPFAITTTSQGTSISITVPTPPGPETRPGDGEPAAG